MTEEQKQTPELEQNRDPFQALTEEKEAYLANWKRSQADYANLRRQTDQEKSEASVLAKSAIVLSILPVLDDMERAFAALPANSGMPSWMEGFKMIQRKLQASLEAQGLKPIRAVGEPFDPRLHEAIRQDKGKEGIVIEELQKGYKFGDKIIRPSSVVVGTGEEDTEQH